MKAHQPTFYVKKVSDGVLRAKALSYLQRKNYSQEITEAQFQRIIVNVIRHEFTDYDSLLNRTSRFPTANEWQKLIKELIMLKIAKAYPQYDLEIQRQIQRLKNNS